MSENLYDYVLPYIKNEIVFDIGANIGEITKKLKESGALKVVSIEPQERLTSNDNFNGVVVLNKCVSNESGEKITFYSCKCSTISTCEEKWVRDHPNSKYKIIVKETITIDDLIEKYGKPKFIKIDVEGFEDKVLEGLNTKIDLIAFEYTYGYKNVFVSCINRLESFGFKEAITFLKKKDKELINGKLKTIRSYRIINKFFDKRDLFSYFDKLKKNDQGDILIVS